MLPQEMILEDGTKMTVIHFIYQSPRGLANADGKDLAQNVTVPAPLTWKIACSPGLLEMHASQRRPIPYHRTDDPRAATCPACKASEEYKKAMALAGV